MMSAINETSNSGGELGGGEELDFIVEEDGQARVAALSATDLPVASGIDTLRLRVMQEEKEAAISVRSKAPVSSPDVLSPGNARTKAEPSPSDDEPSLEFEIEVLK